MIHPILELCKDLPVASFEEAEVILREGNPGGKLYLMIEGSVEISKREIPIVTVSQPGAVFGEMSLVLEQPITATVRSLKTCRFYVADGGLFILHERPELVVHVCRLLAVRLNCLNGYLANLKEQFADQQHHLALIDEMVDSLLHHHEYKAAT
jgi:CRP-like cAMP-binding protein